MPAAPGAKAGPPPLPGTLLPCRPLPVYPPAPSASLATAPQPAAANVPESVTPVTATATADRT